MEAGAATYQGVGSFQDRGSTRLFLRCSHAIASRENKEIFGVDADQAQSPSVTFIKSLLENKKVVDREGRPVNFL
jgi:hypothetical protein